MTNNVRIELTKDEQRQLITLITWAIDRVQADHAVELLPDFEVRYKGALTTMIHLQNVISDSSKPAIITCRQCRHSPWNGGTDCPCTEARIASKSYCWKGELMP